MQFASYLLIGIFAGFSSGLLGISGGIITIPFFLIAFQVFQMPKEFIAHAAIATSLAAMTFNSLSSFYSHSKKQGVLWRITLGMLPGLIIGAYIGAYIANLLPGHLLKLLFALFECLVGLLLHFF